MRITIFAFGSRGDVQPYIPLGLRLQQTGHDVTVLAGDEFEAFITGHGLGYFPLGLRIRETVSESAEARAILEGQVGLIRGLRELVRKAIPAFEQMLHSTWLTCRDAEAIIFSTLGMAAYHVAEKTRVPCFWALTMPVFTRTRVLPSPLLPPPPIEIGSINWLTHWVSELAWQQITRGFNDWRRQTLGLSAIPLTRWPYERLNGYSIPKLHHYSSYVILQPSDWGAHNHITGYWFLDDDPGWQPPASLLDFLVSGPPPVYVGFGSMAERRAEETAGVVLKALRQSGQRGILVSGWSGITGEGDDIYTAEAIPHAWLFPRMAAVVHHGGAGTTAAGLRAGVPSILVPFAGDQPFWAWRIGKLGVGPKAIPRSGLRADRLAAAITQAVSDRSMRDRAAALGEKIRAENGVGRAVEIIEGYLASW